MSGAQRRGYTSIEFAKMLLESGAVARHRVWSVREGYIRFSLTVSGDTNGDQWKKQSPG
jgi:hypothetical protein